jgi:hypothetical protein
MVINNIKSEYFGGECLAAMSGYVPSSRLKTQPALKQLF